jgi:predicted bacteriocin transport accessory protein
MLKKLSNKKIIIPILVLIVIIIIILLIINKDNITLLSNVDNRFKDEYEKYNNELSEDDKEYPSVNISTKTNIKYVTISEVLNALDNGTKVIYIGTSTCIYCRSAVPVLIDACNDNDLDELYYLDLEEIQDVKELDEDNNIITTKEASDKYFDLLDKLDEKLKDELTIEYTLVSSEGNTIDTKEKRIEEPLILFVVEGEVVSYWKGTLFSQTDPYAELDDSQKEGLKEIYSSGIKDVLGINKE